MVSFTGMACLSMTVVYGSINAFTFRSLRAVVVTVFMALVARKLFNGFVAMNFVDSCSKQVGMEQMLGDANFRKTIAGLSSTQPTFVLILNQHALNMTLNWLCNTQSMNGVHESSLIVTLDERSHMELSKIWPNVRLLNWVVPCLQDPFNYGDGKYQLLYLFRANLAQALLSLGKPFWMVQQDTFWRRNLLTLNLSNYGGASDIMFDRGTNSDNPLIAGGYFRINPTASSRKYFAELANALRWWYAPDNAYMTSLCADPKYNCSYIPFNVVTNWIWLYERAYQINNVSGANMDEPSLIQFDGDTKLGGKLAKMLQLGFYFLREDGVSCNEAAIEIADSIVRNPLPNKLSSHGDENRLSFANKLSQWRSYSHWQFDAYKNIIDLFYKTRFTETLLNRIIFPYAHYFMITL